MESELGSLFQSATREDMKATPPHSGLHTVAAGHRKSIQRSKSPQIKVNGAIMAASEVGLRLHIMNGSPFVKCKA